MLRAKPRVQAGKDDIFTDINLGSTANDSPAAMVVAKKHAACIVGSSGRWVPYKLQVTPRVGDATFAYLSAVSDMRVLADEDATAAFVGTWPWTDTQESQHASIC
jgi:hypothetical protein